MKCHLGVGLLMKGNIDVEISDLSDWKLVRNAVFLVEGFFFFLLNS